MPLEKFTNTFGIEELKRGNFPHKFNRADNLDYEDAISALEYYETDCMNKKKKEAVEKWYTEEVAKGEVWNFKKEPLAYCESEVQLLKQGCLQFAADLKWSVVLILSKKTLLLLVPVITFGVTIK